MAIQQILIFGEDLNDANALKHLVHAILGKKYNIVTLRDPPILEKNAERAKQRKNASIVSGLVKARQSRAPVKTIIIHRDCDEIEPAHISLEAHLCQTYAVPNVEVIAAAPAFEMEAWWFMWPQAFEKINSKWEKIKCETSNHGYKKDAKEKLRRALRSKNKKTNDYSEADGPRIAQAILDMNIIHKRCGTSKSFENFLVSLQKI